MADAEPTSSSHSARPMDVFGNVELLTPKAQPVAIHTRELQQVDDSPPVTPYTPIGIRPPSSRAGSRRTQSVDVASKHLNGPSPLGPTRRKRGEREKEREKIRAELDAAPSLTLDPRIAHDVLDLERRFVAASKGKSPAPRPPHRTHRPRNSLPSPAVRPHIPVRADSVDHQALSALPESDTTSFSGGDQKPPELVGPALPSSGVQSPTSPPALTQPLPPAQPVSPPTALKVDKSAYAALLPTSDPEASGSGAEVKRTTKAAKRTSLTAMLGLGSRKKPKEAGHQKDSAPEEDKISPLRPSPKRVETHHTTRTMNTILTTHTGATAGSIESGSVSGLGSGQGLSPVSGAKSASAASSNPKLVEEPFAVIEPSAKTLARAAATRDQLQKRYAMLYASLGDTSSSMGSEEHSTRSVSGSGSMLKRASPGPGSSSIDSHPRPSSKEHPPLKARGLNLLQVVRWRSGVLQRARRSAELSRTEIEGRHGEEWEREVERRIRDAPPGEHYAGSGVPAYQNLIPAAALGDSLPEANSLSWLPYLEPVFAEERARAEGSGEFGLGGRPLGSGPDVPKGMSAWYVLASFVEGYVAAKEQDEQKALAMEAELGVVRGADASFVSEGFKSFVSEGPRSLGSDMHARPMHLDLHLKDLHSKSITYDVRAQALVNAAAHAHARGAGNGTISDDAASGTGSRLAAVGRALRPKSRRNSTIADSISGVRSRQGSVGLGTTSEPPSPSHFTAFSQPILSSATPSTSQLSHPGARALGMPNTATWLSPPNQGETRPARSQSGSRLHSRTHSRSQSQARSISAGNSGHKSTMSGDLNLNGNGNGVNFKPPMQPGVGEGKSMSPAASRMNLANILMGGAAVFGLAGMRRGTGAGRQYMAKEGVSGSENENDSGQVSSDMSPSDGARARRRRRMGTEFSGAGASDGEGGRVKRRKKTWRERENEKGAVPLSDGGEVDEVMWRRSLRMEKTVMLPVEVQTEKSDQEEEDKERVYERKNRTREEARETLEDVNARLHSFAQLLDELNTVHHEGADIFGEMFMAVPEEVVTILTPDLSEDEGTPLSASPITPTHPHNLIPLREFAKKLDTLEGNPTAVDHVGRSKLDADLPLAAFAALGELDTKLNALAKQIGDLRQFCDDAEQERRFVKLLYENTAGNVGTTYPECTHIEQLLSTLVTEDMPWLPSWLPLWVRHLLEIFSNQIQFMVENGLRIYGYVYSVVSLFVVLFTLIFSVLFMFARFVRAYWWGFLASGLAGLAYLMTRPPEGMGVVDMGT